jgi:hypothetical protein
MAGGTSLSGLSYDFGVQIAKGTVSYLAKTVASVTALTGSIHALVHATNKLDGMLVKNQIAFGGYANTLKAIHHAEDLVAKGIGYSAEDLLEGFKLLQRAGLNVKDNTDLVAKAAKAAGVEFAEMARIIKSGNFNALAEMGIITERTALSMNRFGYNTFQASKQVKALLEEANKKGLFENAVTSIPKILKRFKQFKEDFLFAIIGDPKDPEGLAYNVKKYMTQIADFINKHRNKIIYYGKLIGIAFKLTINVVADLLKKVFGYLGKLMGVRDKSMQSMKDSIMSFGLWAEIIRVRIKMFFEEYGSWIKNIIKLILIYQSIRFGIGLWANVTAGAIRYARILRVVILRQNWLVRSFKAISSYGSGSFWGGISKGLSSVASGLATAARASWSFTASLLANPVGAIIAGVVLLIAYIVILATHWDKIRERMAEVNDSVILLALLFAPILGIPMLLAKYWNNFKAIFMNIWATIKNTVSLVGLYFDDFFEMLKRKAISVGLYIKKKFPRLFDFFSSVRNRIIEIWNDVTNKIKEKINWLGNKLKGSFFGKILSYFERGSKSLADRSAAALAAKQKEKGLPVNVATGTTSTALAVQEELNKKLKTKSAKTTSEASYGSGKSSINLENIGGNYNPASNVVNHNNQKYEIKLMLSEGMSADEIVKTLMKKLKEEESKNNMRNGH